MKLVLDSIIFYLQRSGGGSVYWIEIISRVSKRIENIVFLEPRGYPNNIFYDRFNPLGFQVVKEKLTPKILSFVDSKYSTDSPFLFHSSYYRVARSHRAINVVTIHDFMPELFFHGVKRFYHSWRKRRAIRHADAIICVSESTKRDLLSFYPGVANKRVVTIPLGVSPDYFPVDAHLRMSKTEPPYLLFVGRRSHYKNFDFALALISRMEGYRLIVVGEEWSEVEKKSMRNFGSRVQLIRNPSNERLNLLYNKAFCLLYPSSYEGFGIPIIEAMSAGCPVVALNTSSIPEVANGAALLQDELDLDLFQRAVSKLENPMFREEVIILGFKNAKNFEWERIIDSLCKFYEATYEQYLLLR